MTRFLLKRLGLALITLFLLSVIVFALAQLLPGDVGRNVLGPFASQEQVDRLNEALGVNRPLVVQYWDWISHFLRGDLGTSLQYQVPVSDLLGPALANSLKLAAVAFVFVVPLSIIGGTIAGLKRGGIIDRVITVGGLSLTAVPEFVTAIVLILIFGVTLGWLPVTATAPEGASIPTQIEYLLLPSFALVAVLFGYIARITRSSVMESVDADYTRTAYLKGLTRRQVVGRHVLRNSLLPTIAVVATQVGYLIGGLLVIEKLFNYNGIGQRIYTAAVNKDFLMLESGVMIVGVIYLVATFVADILYSVFNPRIRFQADG
ncbi:ABC transporter permease [Gaiella sp.]|uniref:ABC transporter permease n=1 Tax=Gaiella sp. TaxID=2663207 RepID=UPI0032643CB9